MGLCRPCWFALGARDSQPRQCTGHLSPYPAHTFSRCVRWHLGSDTGHRVPYTLLCLAPAMVLLAGRFWCETLRSHFFMGSSPLPSSLSILRMLIVGVVSWTVVSTCFALLVYSAAVRWPASPSLVASAFAAGYVGGFASFITPSGLGVREGIITVILGPALGSDKTLALAIVFRVVHMAVLWLHIAITLCALSGACV